MSGEIKAVDRAIRLLARRSLALGLLCRTSACPHPADNGHGTKCPHLDECIAELREVERLVGK